MKKGFIVIALVSILSLLALYIFWQGRNQESDYGEDPQTLEEIMADSSVVSIFDEDGKKIYSKPDSASETTKQVNTPLNGEVFYKLAQGKFYFKTKVFKYEYRNEDYYVTFSNDTVSASAPFQAWIRLSGAGVGSAQVNISNANGYSVEKAADENGVRYVYRAESQTQGVNTFEGTITLQGQRYPISFNYFVK